MIYFSGPNDDPHDVMFQGSDLLSVNNIKNQIWPWLK